MRPALIEAGATRFKPIFLTAAAAMIGAAFILTDPIFQGLAISLVFGLASSTALTVLVIPAIYVWLGTTSGEKSRFDRHSPKEGEKMMQNDWPAFAGELSAELRNLRGGAADVMKGFSAIAQRAHARRPGRQDKGIDRAGDLGGDPLRRLHRVP